jgi:predicted MFS family arabinose efflux permease
MRRLSISLYLLVALAELIHWAIVRLIPAFAARFSLSEVQSGALVASTGLATLVVSVPAGLLADRLGARRLTLWAGAAMTIAAFGQALAPTYALLLGARLVFGLGFGIVWTSGLA